MPGYSRPNIASSCPAPSWVRGLPVERVAKFARIARDGAGHPRVRATAQALCPAGPWAVLRLVQGLPFVPDPVGEADLARAPCETLDRGGDCDCLSVLACSLCEACGWKWRILWLPFPDAPQDHVVAQVHWQGRWRWLEVSVPGAELGEHPVEAVRRLGFRERIGYGVGD